VKQIRNNPLGRTDNAWWDRSWNPITGCTRTSPGCLNCYAHRTYERFPDVIHGLGIGTSDCEFDREPIPFSTLVFHPDRVNWPHRWQKPKRVFVCSMSDFLHEQVEPEWLEQIWNVMASCQQHTFYFVTKRPENAPEKMAGLPTLPNVHIGVTVESYEYEHRIDLLGKIPGGDFVSIEPMLGPVDISPFIGYIPIEKGGADVADRNGRNSIRLREERGLGNRRDGTCMEGGNKEGGEERGDKDIPMRKTSGGTRYGELPASPHNGGMEKNGVHGIEASVETFQRSNSIRVDNQPHERNQEGQQAGKPRIGYSIGTDNSCHESARTSQTTSESERGVESHGETFRGIGSRDSECSRRNTGGYEDSARSQDYGIGEPSRCVIPNNMGCSSSKTVGITQIICGAETGSDARPIDLGCAYRLRRQCKDAGVAFWFKSAGRGVAIPNDLDVMEIPCP
jgi:protein gp37